MSLDVAIIQTEHSISAATAGTWKSKYVTIYQNQGVCVCVCVCVCNNSVPLVFLCSISIKKIELSHPAKRELIICCEILKEEDTQSMTHFLYDYGMSNFFSKTTLLTLPFTEKGHHDTGWAIDLVPGAPVQSEKKSNTHNKVLICNTSMLDHADLLVQHS